MAVAPNREEALRPLLPSPKLQAFRARWSDAARQAEDGCRTFGAFSLHRAEVEVEERRQRRVERHLQASQRPLGKTPVTLDAPRLPTQVRRVLLRLCDGGFADRGDYVLLCGLPGRRETHLARHRPRVGAAWAACPLCVYELAGAASPGGHAGARAQARSRAARPLRCPPSRRAWNRSGRPSGEGCAVHASGSAYRAAQRHHCQQPRLFPVGPIFKGPIATAAAIDGGVHRSFILELTGPRIRPQQAKARHAMLAAT